jgi:MFS family permease
MQKGNTIQLGLQNNWQQFWLLVFINALVGGMIGLERAILPELAAREFQLHASSLVFSFIIFFGLSKAVTNYFTGALANRYGRKKLLVAGWLLGLPVPFILMMAPNWYWVVAANMLLGIHQGLTWSSTVVMKIDLVGDKERGLAMGLNEFAGYATLGGVAYATSWLAANYGLRPYPFVLGIAFVVAGTLLSWLLVKETNSFVQKETEQPNALPLLKQVFKETTWLHKNLGTVTQAGLVNNLNDAMVWGLMPVLLTTKGFSLQEVGVIAAAYPLVWGLGQLVTGRLADIYCKKNMLFWGMLLQGIAIIFLLLADSFIPFLLIAIILGIGTAIVYPTFLSAIAENVHPRQRAESLGIFRFWRDFGYVIGAALTGLITDWLGWQFSIALISGLTILSALLIRYRMVCKL